MTDSNEARVEAADLKWIMQGELAPTPSEIMCAANKWCGDKERETFASDAYYFRENWWALEGLKLYVAREIAFRADLAERRRAALSAADAVAQEGAVALTFAALRQANIARQEYWGGSENWTLADWSNALAGEVGEACNLVKKIRRPQLGTTGNSADAALYMERLRAEIGDVLIYLDLLAKATGATLDDCVLVAFNSKSEKLGMPIRLAPHPASALAAAREQGRREWVNKAVGAVDTLIESLNEGLMTDAGLTMADRVGMRHQLDALSVASTDIRALLPPAPDASEPAKNEELANHE